MSFRPALMLTILALTGLTAGCGASSSDGKLQSQSYLDQTIPVAPTTTDPPPVIVTPTTTPEPTEPPASETTTEDPAPTQPPPPPPPATAKPAGSSNQICWLPGPDHLTYVEPTDYTQVYLLARLQGPSGQEVQTPGWPHWTRKVDGQMEIEDTGNQDYLEEEPFFHSDFWLEESQSTQQTERAAFDQMKNNWEHGISIINTANQC